MSFDTHYPLITQDLPGVAGVYKKNIDDFIVEEVPLYTPSGEGEHLYLWVEKVDVSAPYLKRQLHNILGVQKRDIGMAGMKDRAARTRQWLSIPLKTIDEDPLSLVGSLTPQIKILDVGIHRNKLKTGHLLGNRFELVLRDLPDLPQPQLEQRIQDKFERMILSGLPNYYGPQRFGHDGQTFKLGMALLNDDREAKKTLRRNKSLKQLALNAVQSAHFNQTLAMRMAQGLWSTICVGDVVQLAGSQSVFLVTEQTLADVQSRFNCKDVVWTGPMMGRKAQSATDQIAELEAQAALAIGLTPRLAQKLNSMLSGTRRPGLIWPETLTWNTEILDNELVLRAKFFLPSGSYATILCEELFTSTPD